jgi:type I restriction-modification system DNA methylase subunit
MNQHELNQEIEAFILKNQDKGRDFFTSHLKYINQFEGSGGQGKNGATGEGLLYEYFTPDYICEIMWKLAYLHGYDGGNVLEPSCGTGRLFRGAPENAKVLGFEINQTAVKIALLNSPNRHTRVANGYFETAFLKPDRFNSLYPSKEVTWVKEYPFSLVIGNPPFGKYKNRYSAYFNLLGFKQIEQFFFYQGLKMLKSGGLLVYLVSSNFMRNGDAYLKSKEFIFSKAEFVDAFRLPPVFASTDVTTDIIILKKK